MLSSADLYKPKSQVFDGEREDVSDPAFGLDDGWCAGVSLQFASQPKHLHIDASVENVFMNPGCLQQMLAGEHPLRCTEKRDQERILALGQANRLAA